MNRLDFWHLERHRGLYRIGCNGTSLDRTETPDLKLLEAVISHHNSVIDHLDITFEQEVARRSVTQDWV